MGALHLLVLFLGFVVTSLSQAGGAEQNDQEDSTSDPAKACQAWVEEKCFSEDFSALTVFDGTDPGFSQYYLKCKTGFTLPVWKGYPAIMIDPATQPAATWLLAHGQAYDAILDTDTNQDDVSLLMAYALNLDPRLNLTGSLPQATLQGDTLSLTFYAASPGLNYRVEASADLSQWSTNGVTQSAPTPDGQSTATVPRSSPYRFLRLAVVR